MFRGVEHRQANALHAVPHRFGHLGLLIAKRIDALLASDRLIGIHIRLGRHGHDQFGELAILFDCGGQLNFLDIALEPIGTEGLEDDRAVILRTSGAVRAVEVAGLTLDCHRSFDEVIVVGAIDLDLNIRHARADAFLYPRPIGVEGTFSLASLSR